MRWSTTRGLAGKSSGSAPPPRRGLDSAVNRRSAWPSQSFSVSIMPQEPPLSLRSGAAWRGKAMARLKSLATFETRARTNPLTAGDPVARDRWPDIILRDYGDDIPNLFRFELAERWRGYYSLVGEPGRARVWVLYLWDHRAYSKQIGYSKK